MTSEGKMKVLVVLSGGLDSTALLAALLDNDLNEVVALSVDYGQRHRKELEAARAICALLEVPHQVADLSALKSILKGSSQTDDSVAVPEGHYTADNMKATVVPNRNMILLAVAGAAAIAQKCDAIAYAAHAGDHAIYPDCRPPFANMMEGAFAFCDFKPLKFLRPFINKTKADIVKVGVAASAPLELTWSCYKGGIAHCGACGTCVERREAFLLAGVKDPTVYDPAAPSLDTLLATAAQK